MAIFRQRSFINRKLKNEKLLKDISPNNTSTYLDFNRYIKSNDLVIRDNNGQDKIIPDNVDSQESLLEVIQNNILKDSEFASFYSTFMHQGGIPYTLQNAIVFLCQSNFNMAPLKSRGDIKSKRILQQIDENSFILIERVELFKIRDIENPDTVKFGGDNLPLFTSEATYAITKTSNNWEASVVDLIFDYKDQSIQEYFDNRSFFEKVKDWFKEKLNLNVIKDISSGVSKEPEYVFNTKFNQSSLSYDVSTEKELNR